MAKRWEDLGGGQWKLTIIDDTGKVPPAHVYGTKDEIIDKLSDSKINGDRRIAELRTAAIPPPEPMSPTERMQTVAELSNPATVDTAIMRVVEKGFGPAEETRADRIAEREERETRQAVQAAQSFADSTPDWHPSEYNRNILVNRMRLLGLSPTNREHYTRAFEELKAAGLLQPKPDEEQDDNNEPGQSSERTAPTKPKAPARYSTGVRQSDISGEPPRTTPVRLKYTREQLAKMSSEQYKNLIHTDRKELERCEAYYASNPGRRAS